MNLNEVQEGVLTIAFHVADKEGLLLLDLDDLQAMLVACGERADELTLNMAMSPSPASAPSSAACFSCVPRAATTSSANRRWS
jgi:hypothetical protein